MNEMWASEVERRLRLISDRIAGLNQNALRTEGQAGFGFPVQEQAQSDEEVYWIRLTGKATVNGSILYSWRRQVQAMTATGLAWMDSGDFGTLTMNPATGLNNEDRSVTDGKRYPAKYNPDTSQWIFFLSEGASGGTGLHRFPTRYKVWVEWDTVPTLKTGASSNPTADGPALAEAVSRMATGFIVSKTVLSTVYMTWGKAYLGGLYQRIYNAFDGPDFYTYWSIVKSSDYTIDMEDVPYSAGDLFDYDEVTFYESDPRFGLEHYWTRRNGIGQGIGQDTLRCNRTSGSTSSFTTGPKYGESGVWSFAMTCPATTYHNAGSGTIFLEWGDGVEATVIVGGGPGSLPADIFSGGTPGSLPSDIISGGTI